MDYSLEIPDSQKQLCPSCGCDKLYNFYSVRNVPVNSVILLNSKEEALGFPHGDIQLAYCLNCGLITNVLFDPALIEYSNRYEETQGFSPTFNKFHRQLAAYLIQKYDLHEKRIVEIGCGKGEFIALLCEMGANEGYGIDPTFIQERAPIIKQGKVTYFADWYSPKYAGLRADFYVCKMTLEHIHQTHKFISTIRETIGDQINAVIFFQVPEIQRILKELAFWDVYYEHCSYFSGGSLSRLFRLCGFKINNLWTDFDDQYLMIEAAPIVSGEDSPALPPENDFEEVLSLVTAFTNNYQNKLQEWKNQIQSYHRNGLRIVIWGGSSKTVSFVTTLHLDHEISYVVDINPHKSGTFLPGSGHQIVLPEVLKIHPADVVVVMNPIYTQEIRQNLNQLGISPELVSVNL